MIYRSALIADEVVVTESGGVPEPPLLSVSKIVRSETYEVFYYENEFCCQVRHFNPATLLLADSKVVRPGVSVGIAAPVVTVYHNERRWRNLVQWLHEVARRRCVSVDLSEDADDTPEKHLIGGLFNVTCNDTGMTSTRLDVLLKNMRPALIALHNDWSKD